MAGMLPVLQLDPSRPLPPAPPLVHTSVVAATIMLEMTNFIVTVQRDVRVMEGLDLETYPNDDLLR
ncbi:hypothetical protein GGU11DRAFT_751768 [Lentinula aff. detonsa]|nr:hypothetical protein GGU11DRAFT_751768 [Lentinula aff. detonsa]